MGKEKKKLTLKTEQDKEVAVCIAVQRRGLASVQEIIATIETMGAHLTERQVSTIAEKLRKRDLFSIDLTEKGSEGSIKRYAMRKIKMTVPEVGQIKDIIDSEEVKPLLEELERSKKVRKKGLKTFDYYKVDVTFEPRDRRCHVEGFIPNGDAMLQHYKDREGNIYFMPKHFRNWFRANLPLINRASSAISDMYFDFGTVKMGGTMKIKEQYITNVQSGFASSQGTGGRGTRKVEYLPDGTKILTTIKIPRELIPPEKIKEAVDLICQGCAFGGNHRCSSGYMKVTDLKIVDNLIWVE